MGCELILMIGELENHRRFGFVRLLNFLIMMSYMQNNILYIFSPSAYPEFISSNYSISVHASASQSDCQSKVSPASIIIKFSIQYLIFIYYHKTIIKYLPYFLNWSCSSRFCGILRWVILSYWLDYYLVRPMAVRRLMPWMPSCQKSNLWCLNY